jgi:hypothetical protein
MSLTSRCKQLKRSIDTNIKSLNDATDRLHAVERLQATERKAGDEIVYRNLICQAMAEIIKDVRELSTTLECRRELTQQELVSYAQMSNNLRQHLVAQLNDFYNKHFNEARKFAETNHRVNSEYWSAIRELDLLTAYVGAVADPADVAISGAAAAFVMPSAAAAVFAAPFPVAQPSGSGFDDDDLRDEILAIRGINSVNESNYVQYLNALYTMYRTTGGRRTKQEFVNNLYDLIIKRNAGGRKLKRYIKKKQSKRRVSNKRKNKRRSKKQR